MTAADIRAWRARLGMSQQAAADALGVHQNSIRAWEQGKQPIDRRTALACAAVYHKVEPWGG